MAEIPPQKMYLLTLGLLHSHRLKLYTILDFLSVIGLNIPTEYITCNSSNSKHMFNI